MDLRDCVSVSNRLTGNVSRFALATSALCWLAVGGAHVVAADGWATLAGRVTLVGGIPVLPPLVTQGDENVKDAAHCAAHEVPNEALVVDARTKGIRNVFVYLRRKPQRIHPDLLEVLPKEVEFDQKGCRFLKHATAMHRGQTLLLKNSDAVPHGTNVQGGPRSANPLFPPNCEPDRYRFTRARPVPVPVTCNLHPWMKAWVLVQDHPYFAVTDENGRFAIEKLPAGTELEFRVWHEAKGFIDSVDGSIQRGVLNVTLEPDVTTTRNIEIDVASLDLHRARPPKSED